MRSPEQQTKTTKRAACFLPGKQTARDTLLLLLLLLPRWMLSTVCFPSLHTCYVSACHFTRQTRTTTELHLLRTNTGYRHEPASNRLSDTLVTQGKTVRSVISKDCQHHTATRGPETNKTTLMPAPILPSGTPIKLAASVSS